MNHVDDSCPEGPFPEPMTYSDFFGAARDGLKLGPDRHPKWQRVEPGTVIPAGQPHAKEYRQKPAEGSGNAWRFEYVPCSVTFHVPTDECDWFIDSSWKPPLVLPTEPGSVIEASVEDDDGKGFTAKFMRGLRGRKPWVDSDVGNWYGDDELSDVRVLFDAGSER